MTRVLLISVLDRPRAISLSTSVSRWVSALSVAGKGGSSRGRRAKSAISRRVSVAPFIYLTLATLGPLLTYEHAVQAHVSAEPGLRQKIRQLSTATGTAGVRVRDAGLLKDGLDENLQVYAPEEIWTFDLAFDVIAMLGAIDGLRGGTRASIVDSLRSLDRTAHLHAFKKDLKKAGPGPEALRELRDRIPHRTT